MNVIDHLEREWPSLVAGAPARRALRRWGAEDEALAFDDLSALEARCHRRDDPGGSDAILGALARRARSDDLAARVLLHLLLPGCKALVARCPVGPYDERVGFVVATAYERIRTYPYERRPRRVAANVLLDVRHALVRSAPWSDRARPALDPGAADRLAARPEPHADVREAVVLMAQAVERGVVDADAARLIVLTRLGGLTVGDVAKATGERAQTVRQRRLRAEARLRREAGVS